MTDHTRILVVALNVVVLAIVALAEVGVVPATVPLGLGLVAVAVGSLVWVGLRVAPNGLLAGR